MVSIHYPCAPLGMWTRKSLKTVKTDKDIFKETGIVGKRNLKFNPRQYDGTEYSTRLFDVSNS